MYHLISKTRTSSTSSKACFSYPNIKTNDTRVTFCHVVNIQRMSEWYFAFMLQAVFLEGVRPHATRGVVLSRFRNVEILQSIKKIEYISELEYDDMSIF